MTSRNQRWYYLQRAQEALRRAGEASDPAIVAVHREFHRLYMKRASEGVEAGARMKAVK